MDQESREDFSDNEPNEKDFGSIDHMKESPARDSMTGQEKINQSTQSISPDPIRKAKNYSENESSVNSEYYPGKTTMNG